LLMLVIIIALLIIVWRQVRWWTCINLISRSLIRVLKSEEISWMIAWCLVIMLLLLLLHYLVEKLASFLQTVSPLNIRLLYLLAQRLGI
jgi:hypothetical protein